jgi:DNA-binding transcriptional LysR family regulator
MNSLEGLAAAAREGAGIVRVPSRLASPKITAFVDYPVERWRGHRSVWRTALRWQINRITVQFLNHAR